MDRQEKKTENGARDVMRSESVAQANFNVRATCPRRLHMSWGEEKSGVWGEKNSMERILGKRRVQGGPVRRLKQEELKRCALRAAQCECSGI